MALITCADCGNQVSAKAASCPKCGAPVSGGDTPARTEMPTKANQPVRVVRAGFRWEIIGGAGVIVAVIMGIAGFGMAATVVGVAGFVVFMIGRAIN